MKKIVIVTNKYPNPIEKNVLVFVQQLVWTLADEGIDCSVICPVPVNINPRYLKFPYKTSEQSENGTIINLYFPKYIGFGQSDILGYNPAGITTNNFTYAIDKVISGMKEKPDAIYGHFVTPAGIAAARIGRKYQIPSFMAYGESTPKTIKHFGYKKTTKELRSLSGVVAVSTHSKQILCTADVVSEQICEVFPNGFRKERFFPRDKMESRKKFGISDEKFVVSFVGSFDDRKGIERLMQAVKDLENVYVIAAGKGELAPSGVNCLYNQPVNNDELPYFYSAADIFVLPTLNEGCCNAIIEAMACGLPIVSSNLPFNDDILDESCSIRVDPKSVKEIRYAILKLFKDRNKLNELGKGSLNKSKSLTLKDRTKNIINFIDKKIENFNKNKDVSNDR